MVLSASQNCYFVLMRYISSILSCMAVVLWEIISKKRYILIILKYIPNTSNVTIRLLDLTKSFNAFSDICSASLQLMPGITSKIRVYIRCSRSYYYCTSMTDWCTWTRMFLTLISIDVSSCLSSLAINYLLASFKIMLAGSRHTSIHAK